MLIDLFFKAVGSALTALFVCAATTAHAAPYTPTSDAEVVERLPGRASDPAIRRVDSLRKQLAARPDDLALRVEIARRYFDLAMAQGDPRYVGYASAALAPLAKAPPNNADYAMVRGLLLQFGHEFEPALASLAKASELNPASPEPLLWRSAIYMVQARYKEAAAECTRAAPLV
jgi:tetratricopeptide (TPR) repeat protein